MTAKKKTTATKGDAPVSRAEFNQLDTAVSSLVELLSGGEFVKQIADVVKAQIPAPIPVLTPVQLKEEIEVKAASGNTVSVNPEWDKQAKEIIGDEFVDHTEVEHLKNGGILFTVVIKLEKSNMPSFYIDQVKTDRRTREVGADGIGGVIEWCKLIKQNIGRGKNINQA